MPSAPNSRNIRHLLRRRTNYAPDHLKKIEGRQFQIFEVLATKILSLQNNHLKWTVTPLQNDGGIDFYGELPILFGPAVETPASLLIAGQCKVLDDLEQAQNPVKRLGADFTSTFAHLESHPALLIGCLLGKVSPEDAESAAATFARAFKVEARVLGQLELESLLKFYFSELEEILVLSDLETADISALRMYFQNLNVPSGTVHLESRLLSRTMLAGAPISVELTLSGSIAKTGKLILKYYPPKSNEAIRIISPSSVGDDSGFRVNFAPEEWAQRLHLKLLSYRVGRQALGRLQCTVEGTVVSEIQLPNVELQDAFTPPFFWTPRLRAHADTVYQALSQVREGDSRLFAVVGHGGSGKSRFCDEVGYLAENAGFQRLSLSHPKTHSEPYQIVRSLVLALGDTLFASCKEGEEVADHFSRSILNLNTSFGRRIEKSLQALLGQSLEVGSEQELNLDNMADLIVFLLRLSSNRRALFLHLSDLHWADQRILGLLLTIQGRLNLQRGRGVSRILTILEGRIGEAVGLLDNSEMVISPFFGDLVPLAADRVIHIEALTSQETTGLLESFLEGRETPGRNVSSALLPHQELLKQQVLKLAVGNPMHVVETLRLLRDRGYLKVNARNGRLYLVELPREETLIQSKVGATIRARFSYLKETRRSLALSLQCLGWIKDNISLALFQHTISHLDLECDLDALTATGFVKVAKRGSSIGFSHENFYHVVSTSSVDPDFNDEICKAYDSWLRSKPQNASTLFDRAIAQRRLREPKLQEINLLLRRSANSAERGHESALLAHVLRELISTEKSLQLLEPKESRIIDISHIVRRWSGLNVLHGDWDESVEELETVIGEIQSYYQSMQRAVPECLYELACGYRELASCQLNQLKSQAAIQNLLNAMDIFKRLKEFAVVKPEAGVDYDLLSTSCLNRLGVAYKIDGNIDEAARISQEALDRASPAIKPDLFHDWARSQTLLDPSRGPLFFDHCRSHLAQENPQDRRLLMISISTLIAEAMALETQGYSCIQRNANRMMVGAQNLYGLAIKRSLGPELGASSLLVGSLAAIEGNFEKAYQWLFEAVRVNFFRRHLEMLWKSHLNLAQVCLQIGGREHREIAYQHALYAFEYLVVNDLENRKSSSHANMRFAKLRLPLSVLQDILSAYPVKNSPSDPLLRSRRLIHRIRYQYIPPARPLEYFRNSEIVMFNF